MCASKADVSPKQLAPFSAPAVYTCYHSKTAPARRTLLLTQAAVVSTALYCVFCTAYLSGKQGLQPWPAAAMTLLGMPAGVATDSRLFGVLAAVLLPEAAFKVLATDPVLKGETAGCSLVLGQSE